MLQPVSGGIVNINDKNTEMKRMLSIMAWITHDQRFSAKTENHFLLVSFFKKKHCIFIGNAVRQKKSETDGKGGFYHQCPLLEISILPLKKLFHLSKSWKS